MAEFNLSILVEAIDRASEVMAHIGESAHKLAEGVAAAGEHAEKAGQSSHHAAEEFQEGSNRLEEISEKMRSIQQGLMSVGEEFARAGERILSTIGEMVDHTAEAEVAMLHFSQSTGIGVESLSRWAYVAGQSDVSTEALNMAMRHMALVFVEASEGGQEAIRTLQTLHVSMRDLQGMTPDERIHRLMEALASVEDPTRRAGLAPQLFGRSGTEILPMLADGAAGLDELAENADRVGAVMGREAAENAEHFSRSLGDLEASLGAVFRSLSDAIIPVLTDLLRTITPVIAQVAEWVRSHEGLAKVLLMVAAGVGVVVAAVGGLMLFVGTVQLVGLTLSALPAAIELVTGAVGVLTGAFGALDLAAAPVAGPLALIAALAGGGYLLSGALQPPAREEKERARGEGREALPSPEGTGFSGATSLHVVHIHADGQLGRDVIDQRIEQWGRSFQGATIAMAPG